ncbi:MAG: exodeoxyribonuclease V subunit gamma [Lachnospiraceae bacterium]|nr:exodeoxyribonuclease V subunit gamma [Lachnospiraceae bacterium]
MNSLDEDKKVRLIIGNHGSGKSDWLYNRFIDISRQKDKSKINFENKLYLVVPEQDTNDKQRLLMKYFEKYGSGILNVDVVSFDRLAHNVFDLLGIEPEKENVIDDSGKTMILSQVIKELCRSNKIKYYGKMINKIGFAKKMTEAMSEIYSYNLIVEEDNKIIEDKLKKIIDEFQNNNSLMSNKLSDLREIYLSFTSKLRNLNYSIKETKYSLLNKVINDAKQLFENATVAFEGFTGFTPIQLDIFKKIVAMSNQTFVVIDYRNENSNERIKSLSDIIPNDIRDEENSVFYLSKKFVSDIVKDLKDEVVIENYNDQNVLYKYKGDDKNDLRFLEKNIFNYNNNESLDIVPKNITIYETKNAEDEIVNVAHLILKSIMDNNKSSGSDERNKLRYGDIRIVVPNVEEYSDKIISVFRKYDIPLFIDDSKSILNSPYVEAIRSALNVVSSNFSYDSVMRYINSGIFEKNSNIFELDNFIREYGIRGVSRYRIGFEPILSYRVNILENELKKETDADKRVELQKSIDHLKEKNKKLIETKEKLFNPLIKLYNEIKCNEDDEKTYKTVNTYIESLNSFTSEIQLDERFNNLLYSLETLQLEDDIRNSDEFKNDNRDYDKEDFSSKLKIKSKSRRSYKYRFGSNFQISVLNKSVEVKNKTVDTIKKIFSSDTDCISLVDFRNLFDIGFTDIEIKVIPEALDQVIVGDLMRSRFDNPKIEICLGFNQSKVPATTEDNSLIDDNMRDLFKKLSIDISQTTYETALNQRLYLYLLLTNPTDKLIISYPRLNIGKVSDEKSSVIDLIQRLFGKIAFDANNEKKFVTNLEIKKADKYSLGFYNDADLYDYIAENMQNLRREYNSTEKNDIQSIENIPVKKAIKYLYEKDSEEFKYRFNTVFNRTADKNEYNLDDKLAQDIVNEVRNGKPSSVSYIEGYNKCHYRHFLERTIKLSERKNYEISSMDLGTYIHRILELFYKRHKQDVIKKSIADNSIDVKLDECISEATEDNFSFKNLKNGEEVFYGENKLSVIKNMVRKLVKFTINYLSKINDQSKFTTNATEEEFEEKINDVEISFTGVVDKIETYTEDNKTYFEIIDYKSGKKRKSISLKNIEDGTQIQLLMYLDYWKNFKGHNVEKIIPCGAFYIWIEEPIIMLDSVSDINKVNDRIKSELQYVGLINQNEEILKIVSPNLKVSGKPKGYKDKQTGLFISGESYKNEGDSKSATENVIEDLIKNVHENIKVAVNNINKGIIEPTGDKIECSYCPYISICKGDKVYSEEDEHSNDYSEE